MSRLVTALVAGATGKTGRPLVEQLLPQGHTVRVIVRASEFAFSSGNSVRWRIRVQGQRFIR